MIPLSMAEIVAGTGAEVRGSLPTGIVIPRIERDSRRAQPGDLFIAIRGEQFDGHGFVERAAAAGAVAAIVARSWAIEHPDTELPLLVVDDTIAALQRLAKARRAELGDSLTVIGVTGSIGKTSTKEVVAAALSARLNTYRSPGNLNNEIGLPLSLLDVGSEIDVAVLEMGGAYAFGEVALLADIARPKIGIVTNIHPVHLERMGSIEAIAKTKAELIEALPADGIAVLNGDDVRVRAMSEVTAARVITFGLSPECTVWADRVQTEGLNGTSFRVHVEGEQFHINVPLIGSHAVELALAGIATGHGLGLHISDMLPGFEESDVQVRLLVLPGPAGSQLIDDTYNASTPSVLSALGLLAELRPRRAIAVLGDMRELGELAEVEHRIVGRRVAAIADMVVTYGDLARIIADEVMATISADGDGKAPAVHSFGLHERDALTSFLLEELRRGDVVLLKGSRGLEMEHIVTTLRAAADQESAG